MKHEVMSRGASFQPEISEKKTPSESRCQPKISHTRKPMAKEKIDVSIDFVRQCRETISLIGAVRRNSFERFVEMALDTSPEMATEIVDIMVKISDVYESENGKTAIVKTDPTNRLTYPDLDLFEAFFALYMEAKQRESEDEVYVVEAGFPANCIFYDTNGDSYSVFMYDAFLAQKLSIFEKRKKGTEYMISLIVFPVGTNLRKAQIPQIEGAYRYAVARKSETGLVSCQASEIIRPEGEK